MVGVRATQRKGDIATATTIATFTRLGFDVALPLTESASYDLIVDDGENSTGYVVKRVEANSYDWLYVLRPGGAEYLIQQCHAGRRSITPTPDHLIGGVAESGRMQLP